MLPHRRSVGITALVVVGALGISVGLAAPATAAPDFPTWSDVEKANKNTTTKRAEVKKITALVDQLEATAADYGKIALQRGEDLQVAKDKLDKAKARAVQLAGQADAAESKAAKSQRQAGQLAAQLARTGNGNITMGLLFDGGGADNLLSTLGTMSELTRHASQIYESAEVDQNTASALTAQAKVAKAERSKLATAADAVLKKATAAAKDAEARVAEQESASKTLYKQLASLKGTAAHTEKEYLAGVAWEKAQEAVKNPPAPAPPVNPAPSAPSGTGVAGAISYAKAQLGEGYVLGGMGPDVWDCSGLTKAAYASVGVYIGTHSSNDQYNTMKAAGRLVPLNDMVAGDLLWYSNGGAADGDKYHVTLYIGNGEMIEAPYPGAVVRIRPVRYGDLVPYAGRPTP